jgi:hypothetical protein
MANILLDPRPHLPTGFSLADVPRDEHLHQQRVFLGI